MKYKQLAFYYLIGAIAFFLGYFIFSLIFYLSKNIIFSIFLQYLIVFFYKFYAYKKHLFTKITLKKYLCLYFFYIILNIVFLKFTNNLIDNLYILQLSYMLSLSLLGFALLKKIKS